MLMYIIFLHSMVEHIVDYGKAITVTFMISTRLFIHRLNRSFLSFIIIIEIGTKNWHRNVKNEQ